MNKNDLTRLKEALPSIPGILRKEDYLNSAVLIPLVIVDGEFSFLFEKRAKHIRQGGEICFPGGEFDKLKDKSYKDTAMRETVEELGVDYSKIKIEGLLDTLVGPMGVTVDSFIGLLDIKSLSEISFDKNEVEKVFLVPVSFFEDTEPERYYVRMEVHPTEIDKNGVKVETLPVKELQLPDRYSKPWRGRKNKILVYKTNGEVIWGITAALVYEVVRKMKLNQGSAGAGNL